MSTFETKESLHGKEVVTSNRKKPFIIKKKKKDFYYKKNNYCKHPHSYIHVYIHKYIQLIFILQNIFSLLVWYDLKINSM